MQIINYGGIFELSVDKSLENVQVGDTVYIDDIGRITLEKTNYFCFVVAKPFYKDEELKIQVQILPTPTPIPDAKKQTKKKISKGKLLKRAVKDFINKHNITCAESIYQCDGPQLDACEFIESLCKIVGYNKQ